uniref:Ras association domain family member 4 n=1 Tax=Loxodonta africana TaxID=9785 RepID=G3U7Q9_LOXAF
EEGALIIDGLLNISWGLRRPIRLQMQDDRERLHLPTTAWTSRQPSCDPNVPFLQGERTVLLAVRAPCANQKFLGLSCFISKPLTEDTEVPQLLRTRSDASCVIQRRPKGRTPGEAQRVRQHRFSINGHFYNHKTSVFTPGFGSITNVRVNSTMTTLQVLTLLLSKFRVENGPEEFALYMVHESGERNKSKKTMSTPLDFQNPATGHAKLFLMETDLGEEVPYDVAQYIKFEMPVLDGFVEKLKEEEEREIIKLTMK